ncbi:MAG: hypothetical protein ACXWP0_00425 [Ktedonobacterales bacterium]
MYDTYFAITYGQEADQPTLVGVDPREPGTFFLVLRDHQVFRPKDVCIHKKYSARNFRDEWSVEKRFYAEFPPKPSMTQAPGWIAPDGKFYPCRYMEHARVAGALARIYYGPKYKDMGESFLEDRNWIHVTAYGEFAFMPDMTAINHVQIDTIFDLISCNPNTGYAHNMNKLLRLVMEFQDI